MSLKILDVGQCGYDGPRMKRLFGEELGATVETADTADVARKKAASGQYDIVLVNRELNADGSSGIDLIGDLRKAGVSTPLMLVSDYEDAQDQAVANGAVRGFGKSALDDPATLELIKAVAGV